MSSYYGNKIAKKAMEFDGVCKGSAKHHKLVDEFNKVKPNGEVANYQCDWCAITWTAVLHMVGFTEKEAPMSYNVGKIVELAKKKGVWIESDKHKPFVGSGIIYDWNDNGVGENKDGASHIGIVYNVDSKYIYVIEGNMSTTSKVGKRKIAINGRFIRGFIDLKCREKRCKELLKKYCYKKGTKKSKYAYKGGKPVAAFKKALKKFYADRSKWGAGPKAGAACDVFAGTLMRALGYKKYPRGVTQQMKTTSSSLKVHKKKNTTAYSIIKELGKAGTYKVEYDIDSSRKHTLFYSDGLIYEAQLDKTYPHINESLSKLKVKRPQVRVIEFERG